MKLLIGNDTNLGNPPNYIQGYLQQNPAVALEYSAMEKRIHNYGTVLDNRPQPHLNYNNVQIMKKSENENNFKQ